MMKIKIWQGEWKVRDVRKNPTWLFMFGDDDNCRRIREAFDELIDRAKKYEYIVFPSGGIGTGLAELETRAPKTWQFLLDQITRLRDL